MLVVVSGLPGTGKSAVADAVAARLGAVRLSIDDLEDALLGCGLEPGWRTGVAAYEATRAAAEPNLALGRTVVVDAVNDSEPARDTWRRAADRTGVRLRFVLLTLDDAAEHRSRLEGRVRDLANVVEPTWVEVQQRATAFAPWGEECLRVDAAAPVEQVAAAVLLLLRDR